VEDLTRNALDFDTVFDIAIKERVAPLVYHNLQAAELLDMLPERFVERLDLEYWNQVSKVILTCREAADVCKAVSQATVPPVVLKGLSLSERVYPTTGTRPIGDLDLLLEHEHVPAAYEALCSMGYRRQRQANGGRELGKVVLERRDPDSTGLPVITVEIHADVMRGRLDNRIARRLQVAQWLERAQSWELLGAPVRVLEATDCLLFLSAHITLQHGYFDLLWLMDLALVMQRLADALEWDAFNTRAERLGLRGAVYYPLLCCERLLGVGPPEGVLERLRPSGIRRGILASAGHVKSCWDWNRLPSRAEVLLRRTFTLDSLFDQLAYLWELLRLGGLGDWWRTSRILQARAVR